jgi:PEGA domain
MTSVVFKNSRSLGLASFLAMLAILCAFTVPSARAQAAAEAAGTTSVSATAASQVKPPVFSTTPGADPGKPAHLALPVGPPPEVVNRRNLEQHAGPDAAKLLLRSDPIGSQVWINSDFIGKTPMLLVLAPGKYQLELRGPRQEYAKRSVDLLPRETRDIATTLTAHYPTKVIIR